MKINNFIKIIFASALLFTVSCNDDDPVDDYKGVYEDGFFISNEGNYGVPNASVTFVSEDLGRVEQDIYTAQNSSNLGDVLQAIGFNGDYAFLVLNNSNKITVVNRYTFKKVNEITSEINQPRYIAFANNNIYVTNDQYGGAKYVSVYKDSDLSFVKKIEMNDAAERIVSAGGNIFVQNSSYGYGNKITYINTSSNTVQSEITLPSGDINKIISEDGSVYAVAAGASDSYIYQISNAGNIVKTTTLTGVANATNLVLEDGKFYYSSGNKVFAMAANSTVVPTTPLITVTENPYSMLYGFNVEDDKIFTSDANGFTGNSRITVYNLSGAVLKTFDAGIGTNGFYEND